MGRRMRKNKHTAKVGWVEIRNSLSWTCLCLWWMLCLARYLNPLRYLKRKRDVSGGTSADGYVFQPSLWERFLDTFRSDATIKKNLLDWAQDQLPTFRVVDFGTTWQDGVEFCALLESVCPGSCPRYDILKPANSTNNCRLGLKLSYRYLSIPQTIVTATEMSEGSAPDKVRLLLQHVRWAAAQRSYVSDIDWSRSNRPMRAADGSILKSLEPCLAKGGGLVNGVVGKRCKFNLFIAESTNLNLSIDIQGPHGEACHERIKKEGSETNNKDIKQRAANQQGRNISRGHSLWASIAGKSLFGQNTHVKRALVKHSTVSSSEQIDRKKRIPLEYQCLGDKHILISYIPRSAGVHHISIKWHGEPIPGSPFNVRVAQSVDTLATHRSRAYQKDNPKEVAFKGLQGRGRSADEIGKLGGTSVKIKSSKKETPEAISVQAAILSRTSTVHRSLSTTSSITGSDAQLTKQATITRKRVLRRVMAQAGQEVLIHESQSSSSSEQMSDNVGNNRHQKERMGSPSPKKHTFDFDVLSDSEQTSRSITPQPDTQLKALTATTTQNITDHLGLDSRGEVSNEIKIKPQSSISRMGYRRYNSDSMLSLPSFGNCIREDSRDGPVMPTAHRHSNKTSLLSVPMHDDNFKSSPFLPTNIWNCSSLAGADIKEKLLEGGFITHMSVNQAKGDRLESDSTLDSDSDAISLSGLEKSQESDYSTWALSSKHKHNMVESSGSQDSFELKQIFDTGTGSLGRTTFHHPSHENKDYIAELQIKRPVCKTKSDPLSSKGRLPPERSYTITGNISRVLGRQDPVHHAPSVEPDSPTIKLLQSESLTKTCFYISQKAQMDSQGTLLSPGSASPLPIEDFPSMNIHEYHHETKPSDETYGNLGEENIDETKVDVGPIPDELQVQKHIKAKRDFRRSGHKSLTQSISLPIMSKKWHAFEIDSDEDIDSDQQQKSWNSSRRKPKRATLGSLELKGQLCDLQKVLNEKDDVTKLVNILPEELPNPDLDISAISHHGTSKDETSDSLSSMSRQTQRGILNRQETCQTSSSPERMAVTNDSGSGIEKEDSDKENITPQIFNGDKPFNTSRLLKVIARQSDGLKLTSNQSFSPYLQPSLKVPKVKVDRTTQVSYNEIKAETGWSTSNLWLKQRRKVIKKLEVSMNGMGSITNRNDVKYKDGLNDYIESLPLSSILDNQSDIKDDNTQNLNNHKSSVNENEPQISGVVIVKAFQPFRQSPSCIVNKDPVVTVTPRKMTVGSSQKVMTAVAFDVPKVCVPPKKPQFISGHRVVTRRNNRRRIVPDPKFFNSSSNTSHDEEKGQVNPARSIRVSRAAGTVKAVCRFNRSSIESRLRAIGIPRDELGNMNDSDKRLRSRSKIGSCRRRVMFSRRVMIHRRSSSKGSSRDSRGSNESHSRIRLGDSNFLTVESCHRSRSSDEEEKLPIVRKCKDKHREVERWLTQTSYNMAVPLSDDQSIEQKKSYLAGSNPEESMPSDSETKANAIQNNIGYESMSLNVKSAENTADKKVSGSPALDGKSDSENILLLMPQSASTAGADIDKPASSSLSLTGSTEDPAYCGFGVSPDVRQGLLDELNAFSRLTSPETPCSRRTSLLESEMELKNELLNEILEDPIGEHPVILEDPIGETQSVNEHSYVDAEDKDILELRALLHETLSRQNSPTRVSDTVPGQQPSDSSKTRQRELQKFTNRMSGQTESVSPSTDAVLSDYLVARPEKCTAFGTGLTEGVVGVKNNFQVETAEAGNGTLTVGLTGPRPHTVLETNVTYTGDNLYDIIYDVTQPGYYIITVKWSDVSIPNSPFVCKVSY